MTPETKDQTLPKRFIFLGGAEGSGTTLLLRLLSAPTTCTSLGGNYFKIPEHPAAKPLTDAFNAAHADLSDRSLPLAEHLAARAAWHAATDAICASPAFSEHDVLVFKRSFPFGADGDLRTPDLWQAVDLIADTRIVVIYRDPCASSYSALRRGFDTDLRRLALRCAQQLTWLAGQLQAIGPGVARVVNYAGLCKSPEGILARLAAFCDLPATALQAAAVNERMAGDTDQLYATELPAAQRDWLEAFFDGRRRRQWETLRASEFAV